MKYLPVLLTLLFFLLFISGRIRAADFEDYLPDTFIRQACDSENPALLIQAGKLLRQAEKDLGRQGPICSSSDLLLYAAQIAILKQDKSVLELLEKLIADLNDSVLAEAYKKLQTDLKKDIFVRPEFSTDKRPELDLLTQGIVREAEFAVLRRAPEWLDPIIAVVKNPKMELSETLRTELIDYLEEMRFDAIPAWQSEAPGQQNRSADSIDEEKRKTGNKDRAVQKDVVKKETLEKSTSSVYCRSLHSRFKELPEGLLIVNASSKSPFPKSLVGSTIIQVENNSAPSLSVLEACVGDTTIIYKDKLDRQFTITVNLTPPPPPVEIRPFPVMTPVPVPDPFFMPLPILHPLPPPGPYGPYPFPPGPRPGPPGPRPHPFPSGHRHHPGR